MAFSRLSTTWVFILFLASSFADLETSLYLQHLNSTEEIISLNPKVEGLPPCWRSYKERSAFGRRKVIEEMIPKIREGVKDLARDDGSGWFAAVQKACSETSEDPDVIYVPLCYNFSQRSEEGLRLSREQIIARYDLFLEFIDEFMKITKQELELLNARLSVAYILDNDPTYQDCLQIEVGVLKRHFEGVESRVSGANRMFLAKKAPFVNLVDTFMDWRDVIISTEIMKPVFDLHCDEADFISGFMKSLDQCLEAALDEKRKRPVTVITELPITTSDVTEDLYVTSEQETTRDSSMLETTSYASEPSSSNEIGVGLFIESTDNALTSLDEEVIELSSTTTESHSLKRR